MTSTNESRQRGTGGLGKLSFPGGNDTREYHPKFKSLQGESSVINAESLFRSANARRSHEQVVRIAANSGVVPYGRSRPFALTPDAFEFLLGTASQLERLP
jgi:hypothetical protein